MFTKICHAIKKVSIALSHFCWQGLPNTSIAGDKYGVRAQEVHADEIRAEASGTKTGFLYNQFLWDLLPHEAKLKETN